MNDIGTAPDCEALALIARVEELTKRVEKLERQMRNHQHVTVTRSGGHESYRTVGLERAGSR